MCNFTFNKKYLASFKCQLYEKIASYSGEIIELFDKDGHCIFHSTDIEWKREHNFYEYLLLAIKSHEERKEIIDLRGVHFISKNDDTPIDYVDTLIYADLKYATFHNDVEMKDTDIESGKKSFSLEKCTFLRNFCIEGCTIKRDVNFNEICFNHSLEINDTNFDKVVEFNHSTFKGSLSLNFCRFEKQCFFQSVTFESTSTITIFSDFYDYLLFENCYMNSRMIDFSRSEFYGETIFRDLVFEQQTFFNHIFVKKSLSFFGIDAKRIFHGYTEFLIEEEHIEGTINFQHVNFFNIVKEHSEIIRQLESSGKVNIGRGCIKYRVQTEDIKIEISGSKQFLIEELSKTFTNFFILNSQRNLGVEIVERTNSHITIFYFSDEDITQEEFLSLLEENQKVFLGLFSSFDNLLKKGTNKNYFVNALHGIISLTTVCFKAALMIGLGQWKQNDTIALMNSIVPKTNSKDLEAFEKFHEILTNIDVSDAFKKIVSENNLNTVVINQINQHGDKSVYIENDLRDTK